MVLQIKIKESLMPDWIWTRGFSEQRLLDIWFSRADIREHISKLEYLRPKDCWTFRYRMVNCSGDIYNL